METLHRLVIADARSMADVEADSVSLVVTSPPYPMIAMWDEVFSSQSVAAANGLARGEGSTAFQAMHAVLQPVWVECHRVLAPGGFLCINIGDATRALAGNFRLYANAAKTTTLCEELGFQALPPLIWRKQTNAPNKFMGSGMLPAGAYVTLEHEQILIFRKGDKRRFDRAAAAVRRQSAVFWEERNAWFSDLWDFKGARQSLPRRAAGRTRSAAFPFELAYRLVCMFSLAGETVLDPFVGTGTTSLAALAGARNSLGYDIDGGLLVLPDLARPAVLAALNERVARRLEDHTRFIAARTQAGIQTRHQNAGYGFPVVTAQETELRLMRVVSATVSGNSLRAVHEGLALPPAPR